MLGVAVYVGIQSTSRAGRAEDEMIRNGEKMEHLEEQAEVMDEKTKGLNISGLKDQRESLKSEIISLKEELGLEDDDPPKGEREETDQDKKEDPQ